MLITLVQTTIKIMGITVIVGSVLSPLVKSYFLVEIAALLVCYFFVIVLVELVARGSLKDY